jgi:hypothetical protein
MQLAAQRARQTCWLLLAAGWAGLTACAMAAPPRPADDAWCAPPQRLLAEALPLAPGLPGWRVEAEDARTQVVAARGALEWHSPAGLSIWWTQPRAGHWRLRFTATPLPAPAAAGTLAGRVSDLNLFWNATETDGRAPAPRDGRFARYDTLQAWYLGFGANGNRTTRLRHYGGSAETRTLLDGWADAPEATPQDRQGPMTPATRLQPGVPVQLQIESRPEAPPGQPHLRVWADGRLLFERREPPRRMGGHFALRSTASAFRVTQIEVLQCLNP